MLIQATVVHISKVAPPPQACHHGGEHAKTPLTHHSTLPDPVHIQLHCVCINRFCSGRAREVERGSSTKTRSHLALVGLIRTFEASWGLSSFTPGFNNTAGICLPISSFLAPRALTLIRLQISLSECSTHKGSVSYTLHLRLQLKLKSISLYIFL